MANSTNRRDFLKVAVGGALSTIPAVGRAEWKPSLRYPDPAIKSLDPSFNKYLLFNAGIEQIATGMRWCEGPVYFGDGRYLLWSDIPNNRIMRWDEESGAISVFRKSSNYANGNTRDRQGRLLTCEHLTRRVTRTEYDGSITIVLDSFDGKPLNSPNDITTKSDGSIWITDAPFGIMHHYQGTIAKAELPCNLYRVDPKSGTATIMDELQAPNGVCFSPDEKKLYVQDAGQSRVIYVYDVVDDGTKLAARRVFVTAEPGGTPDGFRCDIDGNLWCGWGMGTAALDGVKVFNPEGKPIGFIELPERCGNVCFGGPNRNRLFMTASHSIYSVYLRARGVPGG